jgi:uncharacterized protein DUF1360
MWLLAVLTCLTVFRVTRLLVTDRITERPRLALYRWACLRNTTRDRAQVLRDIASGVDRPPLLAYYVTCPWCVSVWIGAAVVGFEVLVLPSVPAPLLLWAASSAVAGLLANLED